MSVRVHAQVEEFPIAGEAGQEGNVGSARHKVLADDPQKHGIAGRRVLHRNLELGRGRHGRELGAALPEEVVGNLDVLHAAVEVHLPSDIVVVAAANTEVWTIRVPPGVLGLSTPRQGAIC